jgi:hypothetical protein
MRSVRLIGVRQPRSSFTEKRNRFTRGFGTKCSEDALVQSLYQFVNRHLPPPFSAARYGGHYLYRAVVGNVRGGPFGPSHHFAVDGDGHAAWFNRESP